MSILWDLSLYFCRCSWTKSANLLYLNFKSLEWAESFIHDIFYFSIGVCKLVLLGKRLLFMSLITLTHIRFLFSVSLHHAAVTIASLQDAAVTYFSWKELNVYISIKLTTQVLSFIHHFEFILSNILFFWTRTTYAF